ncbi:MAG: hypothetical protein ABSG29_09665 [Steroidobacteraceae bacterium]|jgi:hypothetical protein
MTRQTHTPKWAAGMEKLTTGFYRDGEGNWHVSEEEICEAAGIPYTEETSAILERIVRKKTQEVWPATEVRAVKHGGPRPWTRYRVHRNSREDTPGNFHVAGENKRTGYYEPEAHAIKRGTWKLKRHAQAEADRLNGIVRSLSDHQAERHRPITRDVAAAVLHRAFPARCGHCGELLSARDALQHICPRIVPHEEGDEKALPGASMTYGKHQ